MYRFYHSRIVAFLRYVFIFLIHILAFFESPSSLSISSDLDPRYNSRLCLYAEVFLIKFILGQFEFNKNKVDSVFLLFNFIYLWGFFHKNLIPIESNGKNPCSIFQWA